MIIRSNSNNGGSNGATNHALPIKAEKKVPLPRQCVFHHAAPGRLLALKARFRRCLAALPLSPNFEEMQNFRAESVLPVRTVRTQKSRTISDGSDGSQLTYARTRENEEEKYHGYGP